MVLKEEIGELRAVRPGRTLFVRKVVLGSPSSNPALNMLAVHGTCATQTQYTPVLEALDGPLDKANLSVAVWLYDNVGCGLTPELPEWDAYSNENFALDLRAILVDMVLKDDKDRRPCVLMGHSYAPTILLEMLNQSPSIDHFQLSGFIFVGSAVRSLTKDQKDTLMSDGGHPIMRLPVFILNCLQPILSKSFLDMALCPDCDPALREKCNQENQSGSMWFAKATHRHHKWATTNDILVLEKVPILILHGAEDAVISPQSSQVISAALPQSELVFVEKASHLVMLEQPEKMAAEIFDFLKRKTL